jgi:hypothetical protein
VGECFLDEQTAGLIVGYDVVVDDTAMAVIGIFTEADVSDDQKAVTILFFDRAYGTLHDAIGAPGFATRCILAFGDTE